MNEKMQYASMLEIPVNTCNISYKPVKKKRTTKSQNEEIKRKVIEKVNNSDSQTVLENTPINESVNNEIPQKKENKFNALKNKFKGKFKISAVGAELIVIGVLVAVILLTNAINKNSGINVFMRETFGSNITASETTDDRLYSEFTPVLSKIGEIAPEIEDGIMTIAGTGSIYSLCDGKIESVSVDGNGKYTLEIRHSDNFKTVYKGLDYAYAVSGDTVYSNIPVGYVLDSEVSMCFFGTDNKAITEYSVDGDKVVWQSESAISDTQTTSTSINTDTLKKS